MDCIEEWKITMASSWVSASLFSDRRRFTSPWTPIRTGYLYKISLIAIVNDLHSHSFICYLIPSWEKVFEEEDNLYDSIDWDSEHWKGSSVSADRHVWSAPGLIRADSIETEDSLLMIITIFSSTICGLYSVAKYPEVISHWVWVTRSFRSFWRQP